MFTIGNIFGGKKTPKEKEDIAGFAIAEDNLLKFVLGLVPNNNAEATELLTAYDLVQALPPRERKNAHFPLYLKCEEFILKHGSPLLGRTPDREELRAYIAQHFDTATLDPAFRLIFLALREQAFSFLSLGLKETLIYLNRNIGGEVQSMVSQILKGTPLETLRVGEEGIAIDAFTNNDLSKIPLEEIIAAFRILYETLYREVARNFGEQEAIDFIDRFYRFAAKSYDTAILSLLLEVIPDSGPKPDRFSSLTRGDLEKRIQERTLKLEQAERDLKQKLGDLGNTKLALQNLLEDARVLEDQLAAERDRATAIVSSIGEGLFVIGKDYRIVLMNGMAERILELKASDVVGKDFTKVIKAFSGKRELLPEERPIVQVLATGKTIAGKLSDDIYFETTNNLRLPVIVTVSPLVTASTITGAVVVIRDAREEQALESARVGFISVASHQLRTPLTAIRWFSEMLIDGDAGAITAEQQRFVERIYQSVERMINLVNFLLQMARVEAGRVKVEPVSVDIAKLLENEIGSLTTLFDAKGQHVEIVADPELPKVPVDQEILWQVFQNLLTNANRYAPKNGTIVVSMIKKKDVVECRVEDTGIGIPKDQQPRIFEKFFRANNAIKTVAEGSGLGLSLVKALVEGWGGKVWFETEEGKGTTFFFTIPLQGMKPREGDVKISI